MFVTFFTAYMTLYRHVLIYHEQHHLFRFSWTYIADTLHFECFSELASAFMAQFGYWPWLAALIWSLLLVAVYLMTQSAIRRLTGLHDRIQLSALLPCWMFFSTVSVGDSLAPAIKALLIVMAVWVVALIAGRFIPKKQQPDLMGADRAWKGVIGPAIFLALAGWFYYDSFKATTITMPDGTERHMNRQEVKMQRLNERLMVETTEAVKRSDWDEVLELTQEQAATGVQNQLMNYFRAIALYHRGLLLTNFFDTPQYHGPYSLFFTWNADRNQAEYGGYIYEQLGAINTAAHWESEALVGWGETAHNLINLSRYFIETGRGIQATKFIAQLKQTLFYRSAARDLEKWQAEGDVPDLRDALKDAPQKPMRGDNVFNLAGDARYILDYDPDNEMAKQYMLLTLLLAGNMADFYTNLLDLCPPTGEPLPKIFDEALCLMRLSYGSERLAADGYTISPATDAAFRAFLDESYKGQFTSYSADQKRTLWYYTSFINPLGNELTF